MPTKVKSLRLTLEEWADIEKAAGAAHMSTHAWIRAVVTVALGKSELIAHLQRIAAVEKIDIEFRPIATPDPGDGEPIKED